VREDVLRHRAALLRLDVLGAELRQAFADRGIESILLKGPAHGQLLFDADEIRDYTDVDLLVAPTMARRAEAILRDLGFIDLMSADDRRPRRVRGRRPWTHPEAHVEAWQHPESHLVVDLHTRIRGSWASREHVWAVLRANTTTMTVGGSEALVLNADASAMLCATHCAQHVGSTTPVEDLRRAIDRLPIGTWRRAQELARDLDASIAFAHGLRMDASAAAVAEALGIPEVGDLPPNLLTETDRPGAELLAWLRATPSFTERVRLATTLVFPPPHVMRVYHAPEDAGPLRLAAEYARRPFVVASKLRGLRPGSRPAGDAPAPQPTVPLSGPDWLVLGQETWGEHQRRNQLLFERIAALTPESRTLFVEIALRPSDLRRWRVPRLRRVESNVWTVRPIRPLPNRWRALADRTEAAQVRWFARRAGIRRPVVWTQDPHAADVLRHLPGLRLVHDLTDDWVAFEEDVTRRAIVQAQVDALNERAELVLACSRPLVETVAARGFEAELLPNAVAAFAPNGVDDAVAALPAPRVGYVGTLHPARLDVALLRAIAETHPDWSLALVGPDHLTEDDRRALSAVPNAHLLGERPHAQVPDVLAGFDAAIVPHIVNAFTRSLDPLKIYEYLAAGLPVVSTPVSLPEEFAQHVAVATDHAGFITALEQALDEGDDGAPAARRMSVAEETWEARARRVLDRVDPNAEAPRVAVVIVSFNTRDLLERCLQAVEAQTEAPAQVIVVDNASSDGSAAMVRERFPGVQVIELDENLGFGPANNVGLAEVETDLVLLLNSDAFPEPDVIAQLVEAARRHPGAAVIGPRLVNADGSRQRSAWPFPTGRRKLVEAVGLHRPLRRTPFYEDLGTWDHRSERDVAFLSGACLLLRTDVIRDVGGFDETFYLYEEETDLQRRIADRGWRVVLSPEATVMHVGGASSPDSLVRTRHFFAGQRRYLHKHGGQGSWPAAWLALVVGSTLRGRWHRLQVARELRPRRGRGGRR